MLKKLLFSLAISLAVLTTTSYAMEILYQHTTTEEISHAVTYEHNRLMTTNGMLDVHILYIDLADPHTYINPLTSHRGLGRRETTLNLARNNDALAAINADFFGLAGSYSVHFGPLAQDGTLLAANAHTNHTYNQYATLFVDMFGVPFFNYIRTDIRFYNNGVQNIDLNAYNTVGHTLEWPMVIDRLAMNDTSELDARFPGLVKVVVENNVITSVSWPGFTVDVPENGYVVILPARFAYRSHLFRVGDSARLEISNTLNIDFSRMQTAIGGGGLLLQFGQVVSDQGMVPAGRQPRSAVGISANGQRLILMVVDGRSHSVGVTHSEFAEFMRNAGAFNAMHFDGGGSSTMVVSDQGENHRVANTPADSSQRAVINALGVFDNAPLGEMVGLSFAMESDVLIAGLGARAIVFGVDARGQRIEIGEVTFSAAGGGAWTGNVYTPSQTGAHELRATYGDFSATLNINAHLLAELRPSVANISTFEGRRTTLQFTAITNEGVSVSNVTVPGLTVSPASLGRFEGGNFIAGASGRGYITAQLGNVRTFIPVSVVGNGIAINMGGAAFSATSHPIDGMATVAIENIGGRDAIGLNYAFLAVSHTQAAYVVFDTPLQIPAGASHLALQVFGDNSGHWLRGRIIDQNEQVHLIDFTRNVNFEGWQEVIATLPSGALVLDQIYMVSLNSAESTRHTTAFAGLRALFPPANQVTVPESTRFQDTARVSEFFTGLPGTLTYTFTMPEAFEYAAVQVGSFSVTTLATYNGSIVRSQWATLLQDIRRVNATNVLVLIEDLNLRQSMEFELLHLAMQELRAEGRTVTVVSATATETAVTLRDGIRYINLATMEDELASIRFWVGTHGQIWWN